MKYQSELIKEIVDNRGHEKPFLHYQSECVETWIEEARGAYPKLIDYQAEWLNYIVENPIGDFPYVTLSDVTEATVENVVPYAYKSAILTGNTGRINEHGFYQSDNSIFHLGYFEQGTYGGNTGSVNQKKDSVTRIRSINSYKVPQGTYSVELNSGFEGVIRGINDSNEVLFTTEWSSSPTTSVTNDTTLLSVVLRKQNQASISVNDLEAAYKSSSGFDFANVTLTNVKMPVLTTSNEDGTKTNILTVNEDVELRGIGDVQDTLDCLTGEVAERVGEIVLNGSENWTLRKTSENTLIFNVEDLGLNSFTDFQSSTTKMMSDKFVTGYYENNDKEFVCGKANGQGLLIGILKSKLATQDVDGFKRWLSQNPVTIQYQLKTESVKTVALMIQDQDGNKLSKIKPIEGTMHLSTSGESIKPTFTGEIPVEAITQNLASFIEE